MRARDGPNGELESAGGRTAAARYLFAVTASLAAILVNATLQEADWSDPLYAPLIGAVALTAWYGGIGPGLLAIVLCWLGQISLLVEPRRELMISEDDAVQAGVGLAVAFVLLLMSEILRTSRRRALTVAVEAHATVQRLESLNDVAAALAASASSAEVARTLTTLGADLVGSDGAVVASLVEGEELVLDQPTGVATRLPLPGGRMPLAHSTLLTRAVREGVLARADDRAEIEASFPDTAATLPRVQVAIAAPLRAGGEVVGALGFVFEREHALDDETAALVETMAGLAEQALERARLYERELEWRQSLDRILRVSPAFHAESGEEVVEAICREARTTFGADYGVLWQVRDDRLQLRCIEPPQDALPPGSEYPLDDFPGMRSAVGSLQVSFVPDVLDEARGAGLGLVRQLGIRSSLRTPIAVGARTELLLVVSWQTVVSEPDPGTIAIARRFADQAGLALEQVERRRAEADAARRAEETLRLQEITAALSLAATPVAVGNTCLEHTLRSVGAQAGFVVLTSAGTAVQMLTSLGLSEDEAAAWSAFGLDANVPFARAIAAGEPVWALGPEEMAAFTEASGFGDTGWVTLPLRTSVGVRGAVHLSFREPRELGDADRAWLQSVVSQCAQALERSQLFEAEQLLRSRGERVQALTEALANALARTDVARLVVEHVAEAVSADSATLGIVAEDRGTLRLLAWEGWSEEQAEPWLEVPLELVPGRRALAQRKPVVLSRAELPGSVSGLARGTPLGSHESLLFVPLVAGRRSNGLLTLSWIEAGHPTDEERRFAASLAGQAAQALDRAAHFETEQRIAETLQRSVLPVSLPRVEGVQLAARYLPGTSELDVGGDWFDAMSLRDGRLGLVVGDVVGKGVDAAATMGQLRNALRAFAVDRLRPASALMRLNRLADEVPETSFATLVYAVVDPETMVCRIASAGHPPPVLAVPDGRVELLEGGRGLPLGTGLEPKYRQVALDVPDGSLLLLYSDGLVERRGQSIDEGLDALREAVRDAPPDADQVVEHVVERLVGEGERADDVVVLAARLVPVAPRPLDLHVLSRPTSLDLVRYSLRVWLEGSPLARPDSEELLLATWEAAANAVEHAVEPARDTVRVRGLVDGQTVKVTVEDSGRWAPTAGTPGRGLGLRLMQSVSSSLDISTTSKGTRVTVSKTVAGTRE